MLVSLVLCRLERGKSTRKKQRRGKQHTTRTAVQSSRIVTGASNGYDRVFLWPDNARSFPPVIEAPAGVGVMRFYDCSNGGGPGVGLMMRRSEFLVRHVSGLMVRSNGALRMAYQHAGCH